MIQAKMKNGKRVLFDYDDVNFVYEELDQLRVVFVNKDEILLDESFEQFEKIANFIG